VRCAAPVANAAREPGGERGVRRPGDGELDADGRAGSEGERRAAVRMDHAQGAERAAARLRGGAERPVVCVPGVVLGCAAGE